MKRLLNYGLRTKIQLLFAVFILVPVIAFFAYLYVSNVLQIRAELARSEYQSLKALTKNIDLSLGLYSKLTLQIYASKSAIEMLDKKDLTLSEHMVVDRALKDIFTSLINLDKYVVNAYLISSDGFVYRTGATLDDEAMMSVYHSAADAGRGRLVWLPTHVQKALRNVPNELITTVRCINNERGEKVATLVLNIRIDAIKSLFDDSPATHTRRLISQDSRVIYSADPAEIAQIVQEDSLSAAKEMKEGYFWQDSATLILCSTSSVTGWTMVASVPFQFLSAGVNTFQLLLLLFGFVVYIIAFLLIFSKNITLPVRRLNEAINNIGDGNFQLDYIPEGDNELSNLGNSFLKMLRRIGRLMEQIKQQEELKRDLQITALQRQITPHFLYNSLNTVRWMAILNKQDNIKCFLDALIDFLKRVSRAKGELTPLKSEMEMVRSYCFIQQTRFSNFELICDVAPECQDALVPGFLLQPIVENSIVHGFSGLDRMGTLRIDARREAGILFICIGDNGVGMPPERLGELRARLRMESDESVGLVNVSKLIRAYFGEDFGAAIDSAAGDGTTVTLRLPLIYPDAPRGKEGEMK